MSTKLINHNADLQKLREEGYSIEIRKNSFLLINFIPYFNANLEVKYGTLVCNVKVDTEGNVTSINHQFFFKGEFPCDSQGKPLLGIGENTENVTNLFDDFVINYNFSTRHKEGYGKVGYNDNHHKAIHYIRIISAPVEAKYPDIHPRIFDIPAEIPDSSVFVYPDTNSSRANIVAISQKMETHRVGIIGLGGTGSYILDLVSKTMVSEIHLFDGDIFDSHNAYRCPGAAGIEVIRAKPKKVDFLASVYASFRRGIIPHDARITEENLNLLENLDFVFICIDHNPTKLFLFEYLHAANINFIDVGMGIEECDTKLRGTIRTTYLGAEYFEKNRNRVNYAEPEDDDYNSNIQISELNALNACLSVLKWKKLYGFYSDLDSDKSHFTYLLSTNSITND